MSGKGLARFLGSCPVLFQPLPIGTVHEVFPHTARPGDFTTRVMSRCGTSSHFHLYASALLRYWIFQSQYSPNTP